MSDGGSVLSDRETLLARAVARSSVVHYVAKVSLSGEAPNGAAPELLYVTENITTVTGLTAGCLEDEPAGFMGRIEEEDRRDYLAALARLKLGEQSDLEYRLQHRDGRILWVADSLRHLETDDDCLVFSGSWFDITERKRRFQALQDEQELVRRAIESAPVPISVTRLRDRLILYESPAMSTIFLEDKGARATHSGTHDRDPRQRAEYLRRIEAEGAVDNFEIDFRRLDGSAFTGAVSGRRIEYRGEWAVVAVTLDLTETKNREAELRKARETLEDAIEALNEGFILYDEEERFVMCNRRYREFSAEIADLLAPGVTRGEILRAALAKGQYPGFVGREEEALDRFGNPHSGTQLDAYEEFEHRDGRWFLSTNQPTRQGGFVGTCLDITERKTLEQTTRESALMLRGVLDACPLPITMYRVASGEILYESPAAQQIFGPPGEDGTIRKSWASTSAQEAFLRELRESRALDDIEVELKRASGESFFATISARVIEFGNEEMVVSAVYDLTERRAAENKIAEQRELLHQSEKLSALGEVLASISHELNNPLSVLVGHAFMLQETAQDPRLAQRVDKICEAADRCARIVKSFLSMARQQPAQPKALDVNQVIGSALEVTGYALRTTDVRVELDLGDDLPRIMADDQQLQQVVTNLIINAQHALEEIEGERRLWISSQVAEERNEIAIRVADNGGGVAKEIRSRVFEPLFSTKSDGSGTGIGLALCHRLVEAHGGSIALEEAPSGGAVFVVTLPVPAEVEEAGTSLGPAQPATATARRMLIVDDEPGVAEYFAEVLRNDGHTVFVSLRAADTLRYLEDERFDVILSDIRMPEMDGPALYRILSERWPDRVKNLAFITGDSMNSRVREFLEAAGRPYVEKPLTPDDLRALVANLTEASPNR